jgi:hypothetical protein
MDMEMNKPHGLIYHPCQKPKLTALPQLSDGPWHGFDTVDDVIRGAIEGAPQNLLLAPAVVNKPDVICLMGCISARAFIVCREAYQVKTDIYPLQKPRAKGRYPAIGCPCTPHSPATLESAMSLAGGEIRSR